MGEKEAYVCIWCLIGALYIFAIVEDMLNDSPDTLDKQEEAYSRWEYVASDKWPGYDSDDEETLPSQNGLCSNSMCWKRYGNVITGEGVYSAKIWLECRGVLKEDITGCAWFCSKECRDDWLSHFVKAYPKHSK